MSNTVIDNKANKAVEKEENPIIRFLGVNNLAQAKDEVLSGITVSLAQVPEAVSFAFVAGVDPLSGLYAAFIVGFITSVFGGRPGMVSGATGAIAVAMTTLTAEHGTETLFVAVGLMGIFQILFGVIKAGKLVRLIPHTAEIGFVNGLAIVIGLAQLHGFKVPHKDEWVSAGTVGLMSIHIAIVVLSMIIIPRLTKVVPASLIGIVISTMLDFFIGMGTPTVGDFAALNGGLPAFNIPDVTYDWDLFMIVLPTGATIALIGLIETLMTLQLTNELTNTKGNDNQEAIALGVSNLVCGFFSSMGGCAMIGQTVINIKSNGQNRLSSISASLCLLAIILIASPLIEVIPIAALTGVMIMVVLNTFEWGTFSLLTRIPLSDSLVIIMVTVLAVVVNLAVAVIVGVIISALVFTWESGTLISAEVNEYKSIKKLSDGGGEGEEAKTEDDDVESGDKTSKVYNINGGLHFGSVTQFHKMFNHQDDPDDVIFVLDNSWVHDHSGLVALNQVASKYNASGKRLRIYVPAGCWHLFTKAATTVMSHVQMMEYTPASSLLDDETTTKIDHLPGSMTISKAESRENIMKKYSVLAKPFIYLYHGFAKCSEKFGNFIKQEGVEEVGEFVATMHHEEELSDVKEMQLNSTNSSKALMVEEVAVNILITPPDSTRSISTEATAV